MTEPIPKGFMILRVVAEACTKDIGKEVLPGDIYGFINWPDTYDAKHERFTEEEHNDLWATMVKELDRLLLRDGSGSSTG